MNYLATNYGNTVFHFATQDKYPTSKAKPKMTRRITKILMPHPMPVSFARELSVLLTGYDEDSAAGRFLISHILATAWMSREPICLVTIYRRIQEGTLPDAATLREQACTVKDYESEFRKMLRTVSVLVHSLVDTPSRTLDFIKELLETRWAQSMQAVAAGDEPLTARLTGLLAVYGVCSDELDAPVELAEAAQADGTPEPTRVPGIVPPGPPVPRVYVLGPDVPPLAFVKHLVRSMQHHLATAPEAPGAVAGPLSLELDPTKPAARVYWQADAVSFVQRLPAPTMSGEDNALQRRLLEVMANEGGFRKLAEVPEGDPLAELYHRFPHFREVLDTVSKSLALAGCGKTGKPVCIPPILLRGEPGTGKTYFAQELARVLGLRFVERDLSVTSEAFVLSGMDAGWKNSKPGIVFDSLVNGKTANPLVLLNEVDKASARGSHNSPLAPLYSLLEPTSSRQFVDEFVPLNIDASHIIWVLTANNGDIPEPLLQRLETFDIRVPNPDECRVIAASVWTSICATGMPPGHGFCPELGEPLLDYMSNLSPRVMRKALTHAAGNAALDGRKHLKLEDLEGSRKRYAPFDRRPMGFLQPMAYPC